MPRRFGRDRRGVAALEFALVAPLLCLLFFAVLHFGLLLGLMHSLEQISADAGRYAVVGLDAGERRGLVERVLQAQAGSYSLIRGDRLAAVTSETDGAMTVTVVYDASYLPRVPMLGALIAVPTELRRSATLVIP